MRRGCKPNKTNKEQINVSVDLNSQALAILLYSPENSLVSVCFIFSCLLTTMKSLAPPALQPLQSYQGCCFVCPEATPLQTDQDWLSHILLSGKCSRPWPLWLLCAEWAPVCQRLSSTRGQNWPLYHSNNVFQLNNRYPIQWLFTVFSITSIFSYCCFSYISNLQQKKAW